MTRSSPRGSVLRSALPLRCPTAWRRRFAAPGALLHEHRHRQSMARNGLTERHRRHGHTSGARPHATADRAASRFRGCAETRRVVFFFFCYDPSSSARRWSLGITDGDDCPIFATSGPLKTGDVRGREGRGELDGPGQGGKAEFTRPGNHHLDTGAPPCCSHAHTILSSKRGTPARVHLAPCFDGATLDNAGQITAERGAAIDPGRAKDKEDSEEPVAEAAVMARALHWSTPKPSTTRPTTQLGMRLYEKRLTEMASIIRHR